jgi:L-asparagine oxygenase
MVIDDATRAKLRQVYATMPSPYDDFEGALDALRAAITVLPRAVRYRISAFRHDPAAAPSLFVSHLPREHDDELPDTPQGERALGKSTWISEASLLAMAQWLGEQFAYAAEKQGQLIHNVVPVPGSEMALSNEGSLVNLDMHTEAAFFHVRPHFILLVCLRGDEKQLTPSR